MEDNTQEALPVDEAKQAAEVAAFAKRLEANGGLDDDFGSYEAPDADEPDADDEEETPSEQASTASDEGDGDGAEADVQGISGSLKAALKLDALPDELLDLMVKSGRDDLVAKYAESRAKNQKAVSQAFQELAELKKRAEVPQTAEPEAKAQPTPDMSELTQLLSEELSEDAVGAVVKLVQSMVEPALAKVQDFERSQAQRQQEQIQATVQTTRQSLAERFPKLADDDTWTEVFNAAVRNEDKFAHITDVAERIKATFEYAARAELGEGSPPADATRRNGKGPTPPRRKATSKVSSTEEQEIERFRKRLQASGDINALM